MGRVCPEFDRLENIYQSQVKLLTEFGNSATC